MNINRVVGALCFTAAFGGWLCTAHASGYSSVADHAVAHGDYLDGYDAAGIRLWRHKTEGPIQLNTRNDGTFEVNGRELIGRNGRVLMQAGDHGRLPDQLPSRTPFAAPTYTWSPVIEFTQGLTFFDQPAFDASGNAWFAGSDDETYDSVILKSNGTSGTWTEMGTVPMGFYGGVQAADTQGDMTFVTYATYTGGATPLYELWVMRYEPATGLAAPQMLYSTPDAAETYLGIDPWVVSDAAGDAIVVADLAQYGAACWVYSQATKTWTGPTKLATPATPNPLAPTVYSPKLSRSPDGNHIAYTYVSLTGSNGSAATGIYTHIFDFSTMSFGPAIVLPGSANTYYNDDVGFVYPAFIDDTGTVSIIWVSTKYKHRLLTYGSRYSNGVWTSTKVYKSSLIFTSFSDQAMDPNGNLFWSTQGSEAANSQNITLVQYRVDQGWSTSIAATWAGSGGTRERTAWIGSTGKIAEVYLPIPQYASDYLALSYTIFDGTSWSTPTFVPPDNTDSLFQWMASDAKGDVLLLYNPEDVPDGYFTTDIKSTFLQQ